MFSNPIIRLIIGIPLAAIVVFALFTFMYKMINQDYEQPENVEQRVLERITPADDSQEVRTRARNKPQRLDSADKPPPPPKMSASRSDIDLPTPNIQGAAPTELNVDRLDSLAIDPVAISDRDAQPIRPPVPTYPQRAAERGIEGTCDVRFDVDTRGRPYNVSATCSDSVFRREAERAVQRVEFAPKIVRGQPAERRNVVYPLEFRLDG
ncbi:energy transducer TonB [Henriciella marina]|jgi:periplasmic protein TonB|uniref:TonB family protein n=1 Tax=Henriciella marina TaxID=453851 RepID=A0ABT4M035_9PROT|nr:energy transducer TonB [Henriciella marina]MCZ4298784.1 TonB family protein [Henriciella marina]